MDEIWKPIQGFECLYEISNLGRVKSLNYGNHGYSRVLVPKENNKGYLWVELWKDGKTHCLQIHRLVALHFLPNDDKSKNTINHIDENPRNNILTNLEWCTQAENNRKYRENHKVEKKRVVRKRVDQYKTKYSAFRILQLSKDGKLIAVHKNVATIVRTMRYNNTSIIECCKGKRKTAYGCKWQFASQVALA